MREVLTVNSLQRTTTYAGSGPNLRITYLFQGRVQFPTGGESPRPPVLGLNR
jgi:hypothetical protein